MSDATSLSPARLAEIEKHYAANEHWDKICMRTEWLRDLLAEVRRLREAERWVPVGERLPEGPDADECLVYGKTENAIEIVGEALWSGDWYWPAEPDAKYPYPVTHWRPLPEGPKDA